MIALEFKLKGKKLQYRVIDDMIRTAQFIRNKALRYWIDNQNVKLSDLYKQCTALAREFEWAGKLNSMARQASAERAIFAISSFFANCKAKALRQAGIELNTAGHTGINAWGQTDLYSLVVTSTSKLTG